MRVVKTGRLVELQERWTAEWHGNGDDRAAGALTVDAGEDGGEAELEGLTRAEHRANFDLWHEEDKARDPAATDGEIAAVKRAIDRINQVRNDGVERLDEWMVRRLGEAPEGAVLHSETPGMMLDRLSILALKVYHTAEEAERRTASEEHRARNRERLEVLRSQRADLAGALAELMRAVGAGERRIKVYRQMKMYNDPELNPRVYGARTG